MLQGERERELEEDKQADEPSKISLSPPGEKYLELDTEADKEGKIVFNTFGPSFSTSPFFTLPILNHPVSHGEDNLPESVSHDLEHD